MNDLLQWPINDFTSFSITITVITIIIAIIFKAKERGWQKLDDNLGEYIMIAFAAYSIPTGVVIILCCRNIDKLAELTETWLYLAIAGAALIYTALSTIIKWVNKK
jgi:hypothetical protein